MNAVTTLEEFLPKVKEFWSETEQIFLSTSSLFRFSKKLKGLKPVIRNLAKERMGNLIRKSKEAHDDLCEKQERNHKSPLPQNQELESEACTR